MKKWLKWKIRLIYLNLIKYIKESKHNTNHGSYGSFNIWQPNSSICRSGHFWGDTILVTKESLLNQLVDLLNKYKKDENWSEEFYDEQLKNNLIRNEVYDLYQNYFKRKERKDKLRKLGEINESRG